MSWLNLTRWVTMLGLAAAAASACGGRGSLLTGEPFEYQGGEGGSTALGGKAGSSVGGDVPIGGSIAGSVSIGGTGVAGAPMVCVPGSISCKGNTLIICDSNGLGFGTKDCPANSECVVSGNVADCRALTCKPGSMVCDPTGRFVQVCSPDGMSLKTVQNCAAKGQRCLDGVCSTLVCVPGQAFCDQNSVRACNADGTGSTLKQACGNGQFCDPGSLSCQQGVCTPNAPACNGSIATVCNKTGSGYLPGGQDCAKEPGEMCSNGVCQCSPNMVDCNGSPFDGCEVNVGNDPDNCTGCGLVCSANHITNPICNGGCNGACDKGFSDCDGNKQSDGCETATATDKLNCGGCGLACSTNHVAAKCTNGTCNGACAKSFGDCNGDKLKDGCEVDLRSDNQNCGACGTVCSQNHIMATCTASVCGGTCATGFADCNANKQLDGCEINTQTDPQNCGVCGKQCAMGEACSAGMCTKQLTFSGVKQNLPIASLVGWKQCFSDVYSATDSIDSLKTKCPGSQLMLACRATGSTVLQLAAYAPRADVLFNTGGMNTPHNANGVGWYFANGLTNMNVPIGQAMGFAPQGDAIQLNSCDIQDSSLSAAGVDGNLRLCWHTNSNSLQGGWRCGKSDSLNGRNDFERMIFQTP